MFTAGGLGPANVAQCVLDVNPMAVDASSGMEKVKGVKDPELVGALPVPRMRAPCVSTVFRLL